MPLVFGLALPSFPGFNVPGLAVTTTNSSGPLLSVQRWCLRPSEGTRGRTTAGCKVIVNPSCGFRLQPLHRDPTGEAGPLLAAGSAVTAAMAAAVADLLVHLFAVASATPSGSEACHPAAPGHNVKALVATEEGMTSAHGRIVL